MSGDYTRFTFKPGKRFSDVLMQQGRVQLDSDWNERGDIVRERLRLLSLDNFGPLGVPYLTTPDAFLIGIIPGPTLDLSIEPGRLYVDGLLAELFPGEAATYNAQPFLPDPPALPVGSNAVAYLDVWEREITYIEDPELLDVALGGVDTTTRLQTVWQLRVAAVESAECGMPVGAPPSAGRLTTKAVAPPAPDDPCILPQIAGYRGLENHLYRVEIHRGGALGAARFKWSRDNATLVASVSQLVAGAQAKLIVNRIGRDAAMRFGVGDWVEVTDDHRELHGEAGEMAQILNINEADREITLDRALTGGRAFGANDTEIADRRTRIRRWDHAAAAGGDGLIAATGGPPIALEAGIEIAFSTDPAGGEFRVGDHWEFWARTATATIEELNGAPPRGIGHHYVQLAAIAGLGGFANQGGNEIEDCRPKPPADCCTFVVRPGESIQKAINALPDQGGCVCLKAGLHPIEEPVLIDRDNVTLHGESLGAIVDNPLGSSLLDIVGARHLRVHSIAFLQRGTAADPVIRVAQAEDLVIDDCSVATPYQGNGIGLLADRSTDLVISGCDFRGAAVGAWFRTDCRIVTVTGCEFDLAGGAQKVPASAAILAENVWAPLTVEGNLILGSVEGIVVNANPGGPPRSNATGTRICGNWISLIGEPYGDRPAFGIDAAAAASHVGDNHIQHQGGIAAIRLGGSGSSARGNVIRAIQNDIGDALAILAGHTLEGDFVRLDRLEIVDNIVEGRQVGILLVGAGRSRVAGNILADAPGEYGIALFDATDCMVTDNSLSRQLAGVFAVGGERNTICGNRVEGGAFGILVGGEEAPTVSGNRLTGLDRGGIVIQGITQRCNVIENRIVRCGSGAGIAAGINAGTILGELHIEGNEVMDTGLAPTANVQAQVAYGIAAENVQEARIESNLVTYSLPNPRPLTGEDRALRMRGWKSGFAVQIANNKFQGPGKSALVELWQMVNPANQRELWRFDRVLFHGNHCTHFTRPLGNTAAGSQTATGANTTMAAAVAPAGGLAAGAGAATAAAAASTSQFGPATVSLVGRHCSITGNHVVATTPGYASYNIHGMLGPFIGNVSHAGQSGRIGTAQMPTPEISFNINF